MKIGPVRPDPTDLDVEIARLRDLDLEGLRRLANREREFHQCKSTLDSARFRFFITSTDALTG